MRAYARLKGIIPREENIMLDITAARGLSEEQRLMRESCRAFVDDVIAPFIRTNWQREWDMTPANRLPKRPGFTAALTNETASWRE